MNPLQLTVRMGKGSNPQIPSPFSFPDFIASILQGDPLPLEWDVPPPLTPSKILASYMFLNRSSFLREDLTALLKTFELGDRGVNLLSHCPAEYAALYVALRRAQESLSLDLGIGIATSFFQGEWSPPPLSPTPPEGRLTLVDKGTNGFVYYRSSGPVFPLDSWHAYREGGLRGLIYGEAGRVLIFSKTRALWDLHHVLSLLDVVHGAAEVDPLSMTETGDLFGMTPLAASDLLNALVRVLGCVSRYSGYGWLRRLRGIPGR